MKEERKKLTRKLCSTVIYFPLGSRSVFVSAFVVAKKIIFVASNLSSIRIKKPGQKEKRNGFYHFRKIGFICTVFLAFHSRHNRKSQAESLHFRWTKNVWLGVLVRRFTQRTRNRFLFFRLSYQIRIKEKDTLSRTYFSARFSVAFARICDSLIKSIPFTVKIRSETKSTHKLFELFKQKPIDREKEKEKERDRKKKHTKYVKSMPKRT